MPNSVGTPNTGGRRRQCRHPGNNLFRPNLDSDGDDNSDEPHADYVGGAGSAHGGGDGARGGLSAVPGAEPGATETLAHGAGAGKTGLAHGGDGGAVPGGAQRNIGGDDVDLDAAFEDFFANEDIQRVAGRAASSLDMDLWIWVHDATEAALAGRAPPTTSLLDWPCSVCGEEPEHTVWHAGDGDIGCDVFDTETRMCDECWQRQAAAQSALPLDDFTK